MSVEIPNVAEIAALARFAAVLPEEVDGWQLDWATAVTVRPASPWVAVTFVPIEPYPAVDWIAPVELAVYRATLAVHFVDDGAVSDDPIDADDLVRRLSP